MGAAVAGLSAGIGLRQFPADAQRVRRIHNHDIMGCTADGVVGNHLYSGRALGLTTPGDIIQLHPDLESQWAAIHAHYERIGLDHSCDVIWDTRHRFLAEYPDHSVSVFFFGPAEQEARPDQPWFRVVDYINSKNRFMALAETLGVPVPRTLCFDGVETIGWAAIEAAPYPCYLKAAVSVSGVGIHRCHDAAALRDALGLFEPGVPVQIQAEVPTSLFLNLQYEVTVDGLSRLAATEQVLDGFVHQGNRHPSAHAPWDVVDPMAEWLAGEGIRGVFAFDVAVIDRPDGTDYLAIECNPRYNGASYPTAVANRLGISHWLAQAFPTRHRNLSDIDLTGIEYDPAIGEGVILINWGPVMVGKLLVLLAGEPEVQRALATALQDRL